MTNKNIVLLHGWGASVVKLKALEVHLKERGWSVLLPKLPGFDLKPPNTPWTLDDYKVFVLAKARNKWKKERFVVFGHSFGGRLAIKMAATDNPQLAGIVLCAASGISRPSKLKRYPFYVMAKAGKLLLFFPGLSGIWRSLLYKGAQEHDYEKAKGVMKNTFKNIIDESLKDRIVKIKLPVLILWGKMDKMTPFKDARFLKEKITNSKLIAYPDNGHKLPYDDPKKLAEEINIWYQQLS